MPDTRDHPHPDNIGFLTVLREALSLEPKCHTRQMELLNKETQLLKDNLHELESEAIGPLDKALSELSGVFQNATNSR